MQTTPNGRIDTSTNPEIWSQIVLRLPKSLESEFVNSLREDIEPQVKLTLHDYQLHEYRFHIDSDVYPALLENLPCNVESHRTNDRITYFKSSDIRYMLIVFLSDEEKEYFRRTSLDQTSDRLLSGITPPTTDVINRRFKNTRRTDIVSKLDIKYYDDMFEDLLSTDNDTIEKYEDVINLEDYMMTLQAFEVNLDHSKSSETRIILSHPELLISEEEEMAARYLEKRKEIYNEIMLKRLEFERYHYEKKVGAVKVEIEKESDVDDKVIVQDFEDDAIDAAFGI